MCRRAFHIGLFSGGTRTFAFVAGGLIPEGKRGTTNNQLMHVSDCPPPRGAGCRVPGAAVRAAGHCLRPRPINLSF
jgi:hypothetical protein